MKRRYQDMLEDMLNEVSRLELNEKIEAINEIKKQLHAISPFNNEPVDCVIWVRADSVRANDYKIRETGKFKMKELIVYGDGIHQSKLL